MMQTLNRVIKSGFTGFLRNIWVSIAATSMVTITLLIISTMIILYTLTALSVQNSTDKVGVVTAYFKSETTDREIADVRTETEALPGVKLVTYISREEARKMFEQRHQNDSWFDALKEFSPSETTLPASLAVRAISLTDYPQIYEALTSEQFLPYFERVRDNQKVIYKLHAIINFITKFGLILAGIFIVVTIMVTFNTIRLTIYNRREEVEIMRLVGATNWYIRWPFLIEGILYGIIASVITAAIVLVLLTLLSSRIEEFLSIAILGSNLLSALFWKIVLINFAASIGLGVIASTIAMRKYLRI